MNKLKIYFIAVCFSFGAIRGEPATEILVSAEGTAMHYGGSVLWAYQHDPDEGKPYFHPLSATNGELLSELRPKDHPWHRGLWFSWKYLNGVNYWEENRETGLSDGYTRLLGTKSCISETQQVMIKQQLEYAPGEEAPAVLQESRRLVVSTPNTSGSYTIDWSSGFRALEDVELGRTPVLGEPGGKKYGGYAGLSIRLNKASIGGTFQTADGIMNAEGFQNVSTDWMSFNTLQGGSILMMEHPESFRSSTKWYVAPMMPYYSPAVLFDAPYSMAAGESIFLRYRIVVSPGPISALDADAAFLEWTRPGSQK